MRVPRLTLVSIAILVLSAVAGVALLPALPSSVAVRFDIGGDPDSFVAAPLSVLPVPAIGVGALLITRLAGTSDVGTGASLISDMILATFLAYVQAPVLVYNLDVRFNMIVVAVPVVVTFGIIVVVLDRTS